MKKKNKTRRAEDIVVEESLDFDSLYKAIRDEGMVPEKLTDYDVKRLLKVMKSGKRRKSQPITELDIRGKRIIVLRNDDKRHDLYWIRDIGNKKIPEKVYTFDDLFNALKGKIQLDDIEPIVIEESDGKDEGGRGGGGRKPGKGNYRSFLTEDTFKYLVENAVDISQYLHVDKSYTVDISHNEALKRKAVEEGMRESFEGVGYDIKKVMSPADLIAKIVRKMRGRITSEVKRYLKREESKFLDEFDIDNLNDNNHARKVVEWIGEREREPDFYIRCLEILYKGKFASDGVPRMWIAAASNEKFTRSHDWANKNLPEKSKGEQYARMIAEYFIENPEEYHKGDSTRLFDGLYIQNRISDVKDFRKVRMEYGGPVNYLIMNFEGIDAIAHQTVDRIHRNEMLPDKGKKNKPIYRAIRDSTLEVTDENLRKVKVAIDKQLLPEEKEAFETMRTLKEDSVTTTYRQRILHFYLGVKGGDLLR